MLLQRDVGKECGLARGKALAVVWSNTILLYGHTLGAWECRNLRCVSIVRWVLERQLLHLAHHGTLWQGLKAQRNTGYFIISDNSFVWNIMCILEAVAINEQIGWSER